MNGNFTRQKKKRVAIKKEQRLYCGSLTDHTSFVTGKKKENNAAFQL